MLVTSGDHEPTQQLQALVPGFEAPVNLLIQAESKRSVRIPLYSTSPKAKRFSSGVLPSCNPYLAFSAFSWPCWTGFRTR